MKTITKTYRELVDVVAVSKVYKNEQGVEFAYYDYYLVINDNERINISTKFQHDKKLMKELVKNGCIKLLGK